MSSLPWNQIKQPATGYTWRLVDLSKTYRFWWGRNSEGSPILMMELSEDHLNLFKQNRPKVSGLDIDLISLTDKKNQGLCVTLKSLPDADIFYRLCLSLVSAAEQTESEYQAVNSVFNNLERWRSFLSKKRKRLLSGEQIRGLFAELTMIEHFRDHYHLPDDEVVVAWQGPLRKPQDFVFSQCNVEVKATGGATGNTVRISSEHQLTVLDRPIFLTAVELLETDDSQGSSLNDLAGQIELSLPADTAQLYRKRLDSAGYVDSQEYDNPQFTTGHIDTFSVSDDFPAIQAQGLPTGISRVQYDLQLEAIQKFLIPSIIFES